MASESDAPDVTGDVSDGPAPTVDAVEVSAASTADDDTSVDGGDGGGGVVGDHAVVSPSSAARWLVCAPSARLNAEAPDVSTASSVEGTLAHAVVEALLRDRFADRLAPEATSDRADHTDGDHADSDHGDGRGGGAVDWNAVPTEMVEVCQGVADRVARVVDMLDDPVVAPECRLDLSPWLPGGFGTADVVVHDARTVYVIDVKYGFAPVSPRGNPQLALYAAGVLYRLWSAGYTGVEDVWVGIDQPRLGVYETVGLPVPALMAWLYHTVVPAARAAVAGVGERVAGEHCDHCVVATTCRARASWLIGTGRLVDRDVTDLSPEEVAEVLRVLPRWTAWAKALRQDAAVHAVAGVSYPGFVPVRAMTHRRWSDVQEVVERIRAHGWGDVVTVAPPSPAVMERHVGAQQFAEVFGDVVVKPQGQLTLRENLDVRAETAAAAAAAAPTCVRPIPSGDVDVVVCDGDDVAGV